MAAAAAVAETVSQLSVLFSAKLNPRRDSQGQLPLTKDGPPTGSEVWIQLWVSAICVRPASSPGLRFLPPPLVGPWWRDLGLLANKTAAGPGTSPSLAQGAHQPRWLILPYPLSARNGLPPNTSVWEPLRCIYNKQALGLKVPRVRKGTTRDLEPGLSREGKRWS